MTVETLLEAKESVEGVVTGSIREEPDSGVIDRILRAIEHAVSCGLTVRHLLPHGADRLHMGHRYETCGAQVKYHPGLLIGDARYMIVDERVVVLGFPERPGEEEPTRRGQRVYSEATAMLFRNSFEVKWSSALLRLRDLPKAFVLQEEGKNLRPGIPQGRPEISGNLHIRRVYCARHDIFLEV
jgi:hypothetical protein